MPDPDVRGQMSRLSRNCRSGMLALLVVLLAIPTAAEARFVDHVHRDSEGDHRYVVYVPDARATVGLPLIMYLHGAGERGTDGRIQVRHGIGAFLQDGDYPAVVVFPQSEDVRSRVLHGWLAESVDGRRAMRILQETQGRYQTDASRRVLTGWSMGGYGTWSLGHAYPDVWAGLVPVAGGGSVAWAPALSQTPIWALHGAEDAAILPQRSQEMVAAVRAAGGRIRYDEIPEIGHESWQLVYSRPEVRQWMLNPRAEMPDVDQWTVPQRFAADLEALETEFIAASRVEHAVRLRLGNDALAALSYGVPETVPADVLSGRLPNVVESTRAAGHTFRVCFSSMSYDTELTRAHVQAVGPDCLRFRLGAGPIRLTIGRIDVRGSLLKSAVAGPMHVVIGHRRPVWLTIDARPRVVNGKIRLEQLGADFRIPPDNWYVTSPGSIRTRGLFMTEKRVSSGLVSGLYGQRADIEQQVRQFVPQLLRELERRIPIENSARLADAVWPLPIYRPLLRIEPSQIIADQDGLSASFSVEAGPIDPRRTVSPTRIALAPLDVEHSRGRNLEVKVATQMFEELSRIMVESEMARLHVLDVPDPAFAPLADPELLTEAIPALAQRGPHEEIWPEFVLEAPFEVQEGPGGDGTAGGEDPLILDFQIPDLRLDVGLRNRQTREVRPVAAVRFSIRQPLAITLPAGADEGQGVRLRWLPASDIDAAAVASGAEVDVERLHRIFEEGWQTWLANSQPDDKVIPDVVLAQSRLRLRDLEGEDAYLKAEFSVPRTVVLNETGSTIRYRVRGESGPWSALYELEPAQRHAFDVATGLLYEDTAGGRFRLPAGSTSVVQEVDGGRRLYLRAR